MNDGSDVELQLAKKVLMLPLLVGVVLDFTWMCISIIFEVVER